MSLDPLDHSLREDLKSRQSQGIFKPPERIIKAYCAPLNGHGPRYKLQGFDQPFLRVNSNSYLGLSHHQDCLDAAETASRDLGLGPGAVRFIDGTFQPHIDLESRIARFLDKPAAVSLNSAYTANLALGLTLQSPSTYWICDELNHNSIIRTLRIANVPSTHKSIYKHNDMADLKRCLDEVPQNLSITRVFVFFDGVFSMRGDMAPLQDIQDLSQRYANRYQDGVVTIMDDSHGIGALGSTGRGTKEHFNADADIIVGTFGKAFGVNGGFIAASEAVTDSIRQKADTYIYTNPLGIGECSAACKAIDIVDSKEGITLLKTLRHHVQSFRSAASRYGWTLLPGIHPIIPLVPRKPEDIQAIVKDLFDRGILATGLSFPVVPKGHDSIRFQMNASLTDLDMDFLIESVQTVVGRG